MSRKYPYANAAEGNSCSVRLVCAMAVQVEERLESIKDVSEYDDTMSPYRLAHTVGYGRCHTILSGATNWYGVMVPLMCGLEAGEGNGRISLETGSILRRHQRMGRVGLKNYSTQGQCARSLCSSCLGHSPVISSF